MNYPSPAPLPDLSVLRPSGSALLDKLRLHVTDDILQAIAAADYGQDIEKHLSALRLIKGRGVIPKPLVWEPKEVLELEKWIEPDASGTSPTDAGPRGHLKRLFCCTVLLRALADPESQEYLTGEPETLARFTESAIALDDNYPLLAIQLIAWLATTPPDIDETQAFMVLSLMILMAAAPDTKYHACIIELVDWLNDEIPRLIELGTGKHPEEWLLGLTYFNSEASTWQSLGERWLLRPARVSDARCREKLVEVGHRLLNMRG